VSAINDGGGAFPLFCGAGDLANTSGMSLRDWFAGMALQGYNSNSQACASLTHEQAAKNAYADADAMLAARKGGQS